MAKATKTYSAQVEFAFHVDFEVRADSPEDALAAIREDIAKAKGGDALYELAGGGDKANWSVYVRGVFDHKSVCDQE